MGLDMYLTAKKSSYKVYEKEKPNKEREAIKKIFPEIFETGNIETIEISFECAYWRKASAIHKWFVDNVQEGKDECQSSYVSRKDLEELKSICEQIKEDKKKAKLLPPQAGFFFGGTELDEWYFADIKSTIKQIEKCLALSKGWDFEYRASW